MAGLTVSYSFTDASGNRWMRSKHGELRFLYNVAAKTQENETQTNKGKKKKD